MEPEAAVSGPMAMKSLSMKALGYIEQASPSARELHEHVEPSLVKEVHRLVDDFSTNDFSNSLKEVFLKHNVLPNCQASQLQLIAALEECVDICDQELGTCAPEANNNCSSQAPNLETVVQGGAASSSDIGIAVERVHRFVWSAGLQEKLTRVAHDLCQGQRRPFPRGIVKDNDYYMRAGGVHSP